MILPQHITGNANKDPLRPALHYLGKDILYKDLKVAVAKLSYLMMNELGHGARVAFLTRNSPAVLTTFLALANNRCVTIPMDPERPPAEIAEWIRTSKATHLAVTTDLTQHAREILQAERLSLPIIEIEKKHGGEYDPSFTPPPDNVPAETDIILVLRTAGNTGKPKYVNVTHRQLQHAAVSLRGTYHVTGADRILTTMNFSHPFAFIHGLIMPLLVGSTCVVDHGMQDRDFLDFLLKDAKATRLVGTPVFFNKLLATCKTYGRGLPGVKSITVGLGSLTQDVRAAFEEMNIKVAHCYGLTEGTWTLAMEDTHDTNTHPPGFVGRGLPGMKYKVLDESGDEIPGRGLREGPFCVMSPTAMTGYYDREKETKNVLRGTWIYTGDYARLEGEGEELTIHYLGRKDEVILEGKRIITVAPIDNTLRSLQGVLEGAGFTIKDTRNNVVVACAVVRAPASQINEKSILDFCMAKLPSELQPKIVVFTDAIPRDGGGNVNRLKLRAQFTGVAG